jgi:NADPH:quinone reductase-like Zn-dependent oxidoreductase
MHSFWTFLGCDLAGIVEEVGSECTVDVKKGDRVFAVAHGANTVSEALLIQKSVKMICF